MTWSRVWTAFRVAAQFAAQVAAQVASRAGTIRSLRPPFKVCDRRTVIFMLQTFGIIAAPS